MSSLLGKKREAHDDEEKENLRLELQNYMVELKAKTSEFFSYAEQAN